jgi:hypothetical protein
MTNKFEQLIEYVINDEEAKAKELFHDIVVEKSREIYENLMNEEEMDEECDSCHKAPCVCEDEELDESKEEDSEEELDEGHDSMGGDASDDLIDDVEADESGMMEEEDEESDVKFDDKAEQDGEEFTHDMEKDHDEGDIEDRVIDLEDKLDELMAEFESLMGGENGGEHSDLGGEEGDELGGDALEMDDTQAFADEDMDEMSMMENVKLDAAPKPELSEPSFVNKKSTYAVDSGKAGMQGEPVKMTGDTAQGRSAPKTGDLPDAGKFKNVPGKGGSNAKLTPAPKPKFDQGSQNTRTPFPKG